MNCTLCEKQIQNYSTDFNHLEIDKTHSADICQECIEKFADWQKNIYARLFPTKVMKKIYGKKKEKY